MKRSRSQTATDNVVGVLGILRVEHGLQREVAERLVNRYCYVVQAKELLNDEKASIILERERNLDPTEDPILPNPARDEGIAPEYSDEEYEGERHKVKFNPEGPAIVPAGWYMVDPRGVITDGEFKGKQIIGVKRQMDRKVLDALSQAANVAGNRIGASPINSVLMDLACTLRDLCDHLSSTLE